jgi:hypothetical protein
MYKDMCYVLGWLERSCMYDDDVYPSWVDTDSLLICVTIHLLQAWSLGFRMVLLQDY